jgi:hypothetical protein
VDAELLRAVIPAEAALLGVFAGAGLTWWGNRCNARLQIEGQRRRAAAARRYEQRREQVAPLVERVHRRVEALAALLDDLRARQEQVRPPDAKPLSTEQAETVRAQAYAVMNEFSFSYAEEPVPCRGAWP